MLYPSRLYDALIVPVDFYNPCGQITPASIFKIPGLFYNSLPVYFHGELYQTWTYLEYSLLYYVSAASWGVLKLPEDFIRSTVCTRLPTVTDKND